MTFENQLNFIVKISEKRSGDLGLFQLNVVDVHVNHISLVWLLEDSKGERVLPFFITMTKIDPLHFVSV